MDLPDHEQYEVLSRVGNLLEYRVDKMARYELYSVDRFFVEVTFNLQGNDLTAMKAFDTGEQLEKYSPDLQTLLTGILRN